MANILLMDDEPISSGRLLSALTNARQHQIWTADSLITGTSIAEKLGHDLDLLIINMSMIDGAALDFVDGLCLQARLLLLGPSQKYRVEGESLLLRIPFTDHDLLETVDEILAGRRDTRRESTRDRTSCGAGRKQTIGAPARVLRH